MVNRHTFISISNKSCEVTQFDDPYLGETDEYELNEELFYDNVIKHCISVCEDQILYNHGMTYNDGIKDCITALEGLLLNGKESNRTWE